MHEHPLVPSSDGLADIVQSELDLGPPDDRPPDRPPPAGARSMVRLLTGDFAGIEGRVVEVQMDLNRHATAAFDIVGLAGRSIRESRERIRVALKNSGLPFPWNKRILVNLAPAAERKDGAGFDLAVAAGLLVGTDRFDMPPGSVGEDGTVLATGFLGELGLDGKVLPVPGALLVACALRARGVTRMLVAPENAREVALLDGMTAVPVATLERVASVLKGIAPAEPPNGCEAVPGPEAPSPGRGERLDFADVLGQEATKRGLLVAAAGGHNVLLVGPPGVGKTMLARRLPGILPPLRPDEAMQVTRILSASGGRPITRLAEERPFRAPHHTISYAGLVGGGSAIRPGEVTRAHRGVLFLDELPEFERRALEALREPVEEGRITITRSSGSVTFPAAFVLVAAMNPCPCGYLGHPTRSCRCTPREVQSYRGRISGPLLDRLDLFLQVGPVSPADLLAGPTRIGPPRPRAADTRGLAAAVRAARSSQERRWRGGWNSRATLRDLIDFGSIRPEALDRVRRGAEGWGVSARGMTRCLRVARTIADLDGAREVEMRHVAEALQFRAPGGFETAEPGG